MARKQQGKTNSCLCNIARGTTIVGRSIQFCTVGGYRTVLMAFVQYGR